MKEIFVDCCCKDCPAMSVITIMNKTFKVGRGKRCSRNDLSPKPGKLCSAMAGGWPCALGAHDTDELRAVLLVRYRIPCCY